MTTNYHTAISVGAAANAATFNTPLGALDAAITNAQSGVYNVLDYGASTGGTGAANAVAIQAAIDAAEITNGIVFIPTGTYSCGALTWAGGARIMGAGRNSTILTSSAAETLISCNRSTLSEEGGSISGLTLNGNSSGTVGIYIKLLARFNIEDVIIKNFTTAGIDTIFALIFTLNRVNIETCVYGLRMGDWVGGTDRPSLIVMRDCRIVFNTTYGIRCDGGAHIILEDCELCNGTEGNSSTGGIYLTNSTHAGEGISLLMDNCYIEGDDGHSSIRVAAPTATPSQLHISNTIILAGTRSYGIHVSGATNVLVCTNVVAQNAATKDFYTDADTIAYFNRCVCSDAELNGIVTTNPTPSDGKLYQWDTAADGIYTYKVAGANKYAIGTNGTREYATHILKATASSMSDNETFGPGDGNVFMRNANGANRTFNPSGTFIDGTIVTVTNLTYPDTYTIAFDSASLNCLIPAGTSASFLYHASYGWNMLPPDPGKATFTANGIILNELGVDVDTRIEGNNDANLVYVDAGNDRVGIGDNAPGYKLDVTGDVNTTEVYRVDDTQVVGPRVVDARVDDAINDAAWDSTTAGVLDALRDAMITHGLIAAA